VGAGGAPQTRRARCQQDGAGAERFSQEQRGLVRSSDVYLVGAQDAPQSRNPRCQQDGAGCFFFQLFFKVFFLQLPQGAGCAPQTRREQCQQDGADFFLVAGIEA
jgi:hypothetical protein